MIDKYKKKWKLKALFDSSYQNLDRKKVKGFFYERKDELLNVFRREILS